MKNFKIEVVGAGIIIDLGKEKTKQPLHGV
jgi:hypothetical protein